MGISVPVSSGAGISQPRCRALKYEFFVLKAPLQGKVKPLTQVMDGKLGPERRPQHHPEVLTLVVPSVWISFHG